VSRVRRSNDIYAVFDMREPADPQELCVNSPIFTYASPGYCAITGYEMVRVRVRVRVSVRVSVRVRLLVD
jgi:hypothetical protein